VSDLRIGGTRASSILGVGFQTPLEVWAEMTERTQREDISALERIEAGVFMEDGAARWFSHRTGLAVEPSPGIVVDKIHPWLSGSPDRLIVLPDGTRGVLEAKNCHSMAKCDWRTEDGATLVPPGYRVQLQTYLRITGLEVGYFAAVIGGNHLETPRMDKDEAFIEAMLEELEYFMRQHIAKDIPPDVTYRDLGILKRLFPKDIGRSILIADSHARESQALSELIRVKSEISALSKSRDEAQAIIFAAMEDATEIVTPLGTATWKWQKAHHQAKEAKVVESRVLRTKETK